MPLSTKADLEDWAGRNAYLWVELGRLRYALVFVFFGTYIGWIGLDLRRNRAVCLSVCLVVWAMYVFYLGRSAGLKRIPWL